VAAFFIAVIAPCGSSISAILPLESSARDETQNNETRLNHSSVLVTPKKPTETRIPVRMKIIA